MRLRTDAGIKVSQLIQVLKNCDPNADVVLSGSDHSYKRLGAVVPVKAERNTRDNELFEYYDDEVGEDGEIVNVVLLGR